MNFFGIFLFMVPWTFGVQGPRCGNISAKTTPENYPYIAPDIGNQTSLAVLQSDG